MKDEPVEDVPQGDATRRFAVMGCDWDHVSAGDLLVHLASLKSNTNSRYDKQKP